MGPMSANSFVHAMLFYGEWIDMATFGPNDSAEALFEDLGLAVMELARVEEPDTSNGGLSWIATESETEDDKTEYYAGEWTYSGPEMVDVLVVKAGNQYAAYLYEDYAEGMFNMGLWNTDDLDDKGMSHLTAYKFTPEPTGFTLALVGGGLLLAVSRRRRTLNSP
jgi:hypothetical protein